MANIVSLNHRCNYSIIVSTSIAPTPIASQAARRLGNRTEDVNPQPELRGVNVHSGGMNGLVGRGICKLTPCPRMLVTGLCGMQCLDLNPYLSVSSPAN